TLGRRVAPVRRRARRPGTPGARRRRRPAGPRGDRGRLRRRGHRRRARRCPGHRGGRPDPARPLTTTCRTIHHEGVPMTERPRKPNREELEEINSSVHYAMFSAFALAIPLGDADRDALTAEVEELLTAVTEGGVTVRGVYDVGGMRA